MQKPVVLQHCRFFSFPYFLIKENYSRSQHYQQGHLLKNIRGHSKTSKKHLIENNSFHAFSRFSKPRKPWESKAEGTFWLRFLYGLCFYSIKTRKKTFQKIDLSTNVLWQCTASSAFCPALEACPASIGRRRRTVGVVALTGSHGDCSAPHDPTIHHPLSSAAPLGGQNKF